MGMFDTKGSEFSNVKKKTALEKCRRLEKVFAHQEPDRVASQAILMIISSTS